MFVSDLCSCLHAKSRLIEDLESAIDGACAAFTDRVEKRREVDVSDEVAEELSTGAKLLGVGGTFPCTPACSAARTRCLTLRCLPR